MAQTCIFISAEGYPLDFATNTSEKRPNLVTSNITAWIDKKSLDVRVMAFILQAIDMVLDISLNLESG
jgi:hypothetical protein